MQERNSNRLDTATMGCGCFWCIEALFDDLNGVESVVSGYAGGEKNNPTYREVCSGTTGHAEVVQIRFNAAVLSYCDLVPIFHIMHNPTTKNRQGVDAGSQYRSVIFYHNEEQQQKANAVIEELQRDFEKTIITEVSPYTNFFKAEEHHQQYYKSDPEKAYCQSVIDPKLAKLRHHLTELFKK